MVKILPEWLNDDADEARIRKAADEGAKMIDDFVRDVIKGREEKLEREDEAAELRIFYKKHRWRMFDFLNAAKGYELTRAETNKLMKLRTIDLDYIMLEMEAEGHIIAVYDDCGRLDKYTFERDPGPSVSTEDRRQRLEEAARLRNDPETMSQAKVRKCIAEAGGRIGHSELQRLLKLKASQLKELIAKLVDERFIEGVVEPRAKGQRGPAKKTYQLVSQSDL